MPNSIALITTRWKSTRFPGKALTDIEGKPLTQHIVDRISKIAQPVVVTSCNSYPIVQYCCQNHIEIIEHHLDHDYFGQITTAIMAYQPDWIIRLWGDNPFINVDLIEKALAYSEYFDYVYPVQIAKGWEFSIFPSKTWVTACREMFANDKYIFNEVNEHVFFESNFKTEVYHYENPALQDYNLSIDYPEDVSRVCIQLKELKEKFGINL